MTKNIYFELHEYCHSFTDKIRVEAEGGGGGG